MWPVGAKIGVGGQEARAVEQRMADVVHFKASPLAARLCLADCACSSAAPSPPKLSCRRSSRSKERYEMVVVRARETEHDTSYHEEDNGLEL